MAAAEIRKGRMPAARKGRQVVELLLSTQRSVWQANDLAAGQCG